MPDNTTKLKKLQRLARSTTPVGIFTELEKLDENIILVDEKVAQNKSEMEFIVSELATKIDNFEPIPGPPGESIKGDEGKQGPMGPLPIEGIDYFIPDPISGKDGKDGSPDTGEEIVEKINDLPTSTDEYKIDASHIKNLPATRTYGGGLSKMTADTLYAPIGTGDFIKLDGTSTTTAIIPFAQGARIATDKQLQFVGPANYITNDGATQMIVHTNLLTIEGSLKVNSTLSVDPIDGIAFDDGVNFGELLWTNLSGSKSIELPNTSGTVALTSDLSSYVPTSRTVTIAGTTNQITSSAGAQDLSTNRTWTLSLPQNIHTGATPTFASLTLSGLTAGRIPIVSTGGLLADDSALLWDATTNYLTVTGTTQATRFNVDGTRFALLVLSGDGSFVMQDTVTESNVLQAGTDGSVSVFCNGGNYTLNTITGDVYIFSNDGAGFIQMDASDGIRFGASTKITLYNNAATEGYGVPAIVDDVAITGRTTAITTTNFTNAQTAGTYRISYSLQDTTADVTAGTLTLTIAYTDGAGATTKTATQALTATGRADGVVYVQLASGNLTYAVAIAGGVGIGSAVYALHMSCERLR